MENTISHIVHRDDEASKLGMWIFIFTELLLFGGLFLVYAVFRAKYSEDFHIAAMELNAFVGTANTVILLISSMTVAMSITAIQKGDKGLSIKLLAVTLLLATFFMVNKYFEWSGKIHHGLYPWIRSNAWLKPGPVAFLWIVLCHHRITCSARIYWHGNIGYNAFQNKKWKNNTR
jgi:cytochrome c oxidase subunit III